MVRGRVLAVMAAAACCWSARPLAATTIHGGSGATRLPPPRPRRRAPRRPRGAATTAAGGGGKGTVDAGTTAQEVTLTPEQEETAKADGEGQLVGIVAATMATEYHANLNNVDPGARRGARLQRRDLRLPGGPEPAAARASRGSSPRAPTRSSSPVSVARASARLAEEATEAGIFVVQVAGRGLDASTGAVTISVEEEDIARPRARPPASTPPRTIPTAGIQVVITDYPSIESLVARADMIE